jgi:hypothetical protein
MKERGIRETKEWLKEKRVLDEKTRIDRGWRMHAGGCKQEKAWMEAGGG